MRDRRPLVLTLFGAAGSALAVATFDLGERFDRFAEQHEGWGLRELLIIAALAAFVSTIVAATTCACGQPFALTPWRDCRINGVTGLA